MYMIYNISTFYLSITAVNRLQYIVMRILYNIYIVFSPKSHRAVDDNRFIVDATRVVFFFYYIIIYIHIYYNVRKYRKGL